MNQMQVLGEKVLARHISSGQRFPQDEMARSDNLYQIVFDLGKLLRSLPNSPSDSDLESVESLAKSLMDQLDQRKSSPDAETSPNGPLFESYKILSCALILLHRHESSAKREIKHQLNDFRKKTGTALSLMKRFLQIPEDAKLDELCNELANKIKIQQTAARVAIDNDKQYDQLKSEIKTLSDSCLSSQTREKQLVDNIRKLKELNALQNNKIETLTKEREILQERINMIIQNRKAQQQSYVETTNLNPNGLASSLSFNNITANNTNVTPSFDDTSQIYMLKTDLTMTKNTLDNSNKKINRLKEKLSKAKNDLNDANSSLSKIRDENDKLHMEIQQLQLENEELNKQTETNQSLSKNEIEESHANIEKLQDSLDIIVNQLNLQVSEIKQIYDSRYKLLELLDMQSKAVVFIEEELKQKNKETEILGHEKNSLLAQNRNLEKENQKFKKFVSNFKKHVQESSFLTQDSIVSISKALEKLEPEAICAFLSDEGNDISSLEKPPISTDNSELPSPPKKENKSSTKAVLINRLFTYVEDQIDIIMSIAENDKMDKDKKALILQSCASTEKFLNENKNIINHEFEGSFLFGNSTFDSISIFRSFGLGIDPNSFSEAVKKFLLTFENVKSDEARELFDVAKQAIAMNALLRKIAEMLREENESLTNNVKDISAELDDVKRAADINNDIFCQINQLPNEDESKLLALRSALTQLIDNGVVKLPSKLLSELNNNKIITITSDEINSFSQAQLKKEKRRQLKIVKEQKANKALQKTIEELSDKLREFEKSQELNQNENNELRRKVQYYQSEIEAIHSNYQNEINSLNDSFGQKINNQKQVSQRDSLAILEKARADFKEEMKALKKEYKEKLRKANEETSAQENRVNSIKKHYESLLQSLRTKLTQARSSEVQVINEFNSLENEIRQLKSKVSSLTVDNKILELKLSTAEGKNQREKSDNGEQSRIVKILLDKQVEEKMQVIELQQKHFFQKLRTIIKKFDDCFSGEITSFEGAEYALKGILDNYNTYKQKSSNE